MIKATVCRTTSSTPRPSAYSAWMSSPSELHLTRNAEKDLLGLRGLTQVAASELLALKQDPYKGHPLKGSLRGVRAPEFSLKGAAYRAAYVVLEEEAPGRTA